MFVCVFLVLMPCCVVQEAKQARLEKQRQELAEYEEMRRAEREKEYAEIAALKEKRVSTVQQVIGL